MNNNNRFLLILIIAGPIVGLAGTDLVLPAVPTLDTHLRGSLELSQLVLAAFAAGTGIGLLVFGELGGRYSQHQLLLFALSLYAVTSILATWVDSLTQLVGVRFVQGFAAAAPAVFAPGMIRALFDDRGAMRALGLIGSVESAVPAFAPILGSWLISHYHWQATFYVTAIAAGLVCIGWMTTRPPQPTRPRATLGYAALLKRPVFVRYALSQALALGGLIAFVFAAPSIMVHSLGGTISDFIVMQILGIALFMLCANTTHLLADRIGRETTLVVGTALAVAASTSLLAYAGFSDEPRPLVVWVLFAALNAGFGIRGPVGFFMAMVASDHNDAKATAIVMLSMFLVASLATAGVAPYISLGMLPAAFATTLICGASGLMLWLLPALSDEQLDRPSPP
ncbi:MAG: MFS transporter [Pseudomonadota bacterium]